MLSMYVGKVSSHADTADWVGVFNAWSLLTMFFVTFCIHNFIIAPQLVYHNRHCTYALLTTLLAVSFMIYQTQCRPHRPDERPFIAEPHHKQDTTYTLPPPLPTDTGQPQEPPRHGHDEPPRAFGGQDSVAIIIMALLLGLNVGAKYYFKSLDDRKRLHDLERENLNTQLAYLKYQINPHFFMNTLNNIHALVLIDPEQANVMIETLSKLMRYVLYDGDRSMAPLQKELAFVENYVNLMRVRYTDRVSIVMKFPDPVPDAMVPPLLFATFIENAFKHGVSYETQSFVEIRLDADDRNIMFACDNSRLPMADNSHGGVGLKNARRRLDLIYGQTYTLSTVPTDGAYCVRLKLPLQPTLKIDNKNRE